MNTNKLHLIASDLLSELEQSEAPEILLQIVAALKNQIKQPQQPAFPKQLSEQLAKLYQNLSKSSVENYSPAWRDAMVELHVEEEFGRALEQKIKNIFERNQITPQIALDELAHIQQDIQDTKSNLENIIFGLEYFGVGADALQKNECEVGIIIPRSYVDDNLKNFGSELVKLEKTLLIFSELVTGNREPLKIRQISSSELSVFLQYIPEIAACIAVAVERIVALYRQTLEIKKIKKELAALEVPDNKLVGIDEHTSAIFKPALDELAKELVENYGGDLENGRKHELTTELRRSLNILANRIDRGFNIELRVAPSDKEDEENINLTEAEIEAINKIIESSSKISHIKPSGDPVLFLPETDEDEEGEEN